MRVLFISPHLDDALLHAGPAILNHLENSDSVLVLTVFAGVPEIEYPETEFAKYLHHRWGILKCEELVRVRQGEDISALSKLGLHFYLIKHWPEVDSLYQPERSLNWSSEQLRKLTEFIEEEEIDLMYFNHPKKNYTHPDHLLTFKLGEQLVNSVLPIGIRFYFELSDNQKGNKRLKYSLATVIKQWLALKEYKTQVKDLFEGPNKLLLILLLKYVKNLGTFYFKEKRL